MTFVQFGDDEPEDAWDADDTPREQVKNLILRLRLLILLGILLDSDDDDNDDLRDALRTIRRINRLIRERGQLDDRQRLRARQIDEDVEFVRERLG